MILKKLIKKSFELRQKILKVVIKDGGHLATSFSCLDIVVGLFYGKIIKFKNSAPEWDGRDRFILSKGHAETLMYSVLDDLDYFPKSWLRNNYRAGKYILGGHIDAKIPGIEFTTGSLGHGLSLACGSALGLKYKRKKCKVFVLLSDGECTEGSIWEAAIFASKHKLKNLIAIVDNNKISATDFIDNFTDINNLQEKFRSFGWNVYSVDGHNYFKLIKVFNKVKNNNLNNKPNIIIAETVKGKGINFIENDPSRHAKGLNQQEKIEAAKILNIE